ncbi:MAG: GAF domain-containing protein, partial [Clostridia bacterium]|nr:GAF domain-containing protein [Clostridia bacterium]
MTQEQISKILEISVALSAEHDRELLLSAILDAGMDLCHCDAGTLYLLEDDGLHFCRMYTRSMGVRQGGHDHPIVLPPVPLTPSHICARAVLDKKLINVPDVHDNNEFDFSGAKRYDSMTGYNTRSMMVVPLVNDKGTIIGVMQLINSLDTDGEVSDFTKEMEDILSAVSSQAAISITNMQYSERINLLLDSLVQSLSTAIDEITPYNANHTRNMVKYADAFIDWLNEQETDWKFDETAKRGFLMSVGLHDVGKLTVPLSVMDKQNRLTPEDLLIVKARFDRMALVFKIDYLEGRINKDEYETLCKERDEAIDFILAVNTAGFLPDEKLARLEDIAKKSF